MKKEKKKSRSLILHFLDVFTAFFYQKLSSGFFSGLTNGCLEENKMLSNSFFAKHLNSSSRIGSFLRKIRFIIAEQFEESRILSLWRRLILFLVGSKLRLYGSFFLTFGIYTGLMYFIKPLVETSVEADPVYLVWGASFVFIALPMLFTSKSLAQALSTSTFGHFLAFDVFGIPDEKLSLPVPKHGDSYSFAMFVGFVVGSISYFFDPISVMTSVGVFVLIALIMASPEIGVVSALAFLPVFSTENGTASLIFLIFLYSFSFIIKLVRGKRIIRFGVSDLLILIFCFFLTLSGLINVWNTDFSIAFRTIFIIIGCVIAGNLMSTKSWQRRCAVSLVYSGFITSLITLWQRCASPVLARLEIDFDLGLVEEVVLFGNRDHLAMFLLFCLVMTMTLIYTGEGIKHYMSVAVKVICMIFAILLTSSLYAFMGLIAALIVFFMIMSKKTIKVGAFTVVALPSLCIIIGSELLNRGLSFLKINPASVGSTVKVWRGSLDLTRASYFLGLGTGGFSEIYPVYANAGFEDSSSAGALWLSLLCDTGILGLILVLAVVLLLLKNGFGFFKLNIRRDKKAFIAGAVSALIGVMIQSLFCDFWGNANLLYLFFAAICIVSASIRTGCDEINKYSTERINTEYASSIDL